MLSAENECNERCGIEPESESMVDLVVCRKQTGWQSHTLNYARFMTGSSWRSSSSWTSHSLTYRRTSRESIMAHQVRQ
jgi:hypothetical protein